MTVTCEEIYGTVFSGVTLYQGGIVYRDDSGRELDLKFNLAEMKFRHCNPATPKTLKLDGGILRLGYADSDTSHANQGNDAFLAHTLNVRLAHSRQHLLTGELSFAFLGCQTHVELSLSNFAQHSDETSDRASPLPAVYNALDNLSRHIQSQTLRTQRPALRVLLQGDLLNPDTLMVKGNLESGSLIFRDIALLRLNSNFSYHQGQLSIRQMRFSLSDHERLNLTGKISRESLALKIDGEILPDKLHSILRQHASSPFPEWLSLTRPVNLSLHLNQRFATDGNAGDFSLDGVISTDGIRIANQLYSLKNCDLKLNGGVFTAQNIILVPERRAPDQALTGTVKYDSKRKEISAELGGTLALSSLPVAAGSSSLPESPVHLKLRLKPSPPSLKQLSAQAEVKIPAMEFSVAPLKNIECHFSIDKGVLSLEQGLFSLPSRQANTASLTFRTQLEDLLTTHSCDIEYLLDIRSLAGNRTIFSNVLKTNGRIKIDFKKHIFDNYEFSGTFNPNGIYATLGEIFKMQMNHPFQWIDFNENSSAKMTARFLPFCWDTPQKQPPLLGHVSFDNCRFMEVPLRNLQFDFKVDKQDSILDNLKAVLLEDESRLDIKRLEIIYSPLMLDFTSMDYYGNPRLLEPFLYAPGAKRTYHLIWKNTIWKPHTQGHFNIHTMKFIKLPGENWNFRMSANATISNFIYRNIDIPLASGQITLGLPYDGLHLTSVRVKTRHQNRTPLTGKANIFFKEQTSGDFSINFMDGNFDTLWLLENAIPPLRKYLQKCTLAPDTHFSCDGEFSTGHPSFLRIRGELDTPLVSFKNFAFQDVKGKIEYKDNSLNWNFKEARLGEGILNTIGHFDFGYNTGELLYNANGIPLHKIRDMVAAGTSKTGKKPELKGKINSNGQIRLFYDWSDYPLQMNGYAYLWLYDADLWHIPLFNALGNLISIGSFNFFRKNNKISQLGQISKLNAELVFAGEQIQVEKIRTNGTIIALKGHGNYNLTKNQLDFLFSSIFLNKLNFISWIFKPVTWFFNAHMTGPINAPKWSLQSPITNYFRNSDDILD